MYGFEKIHIHIYKEIIKNDKTNQKRRGAENHIINGIYKENCYSTIYM